MKFDMTAAWNEAIRLLGANRDVVMVVAGVFFFLPYVIFMLLFMNQMADLQAAQAASPDPEAMTNAMMGFYGEVWWVVLLMAVIQGVGMLGLLALLRDRARPTVGEALKTGAKYLLPYLGAQILTSFLMLLLLLIPFVVAGAAGTGAGVLVGLVVAAVAAYLFTKFSLVPPVIAVERVGNPLTALGRSWALTKGNTLRIFLFIVLLGIALLLISMVLGAIIGIILAFAGSETALIGQAIVSGFTNAVFVTIFLAVLAAIHRQLAGPAPETVGETFS